MNDFDNFINLFVDSAESSSNYIEFISASDRMIPGEDYEVNITRAASRGYFRGSAINSPISSPIILDSTNNVIKLNVSGLISDDIVLSEKTYNSGTELANEIQTRIDSDARIGNRGVVVEWIEQLDGAGYLKITGGTYGSDSHIRMVTSITNGAYSKLGLSGGISHSGEDVAGTINGESATGRGQVLTGNEGNPTTEGLKLRVSLTDSQLLAGSAEGTISIALGLSTKLGRTLESITMSADGTIARRTSALTKQIEDINRQIEDYDSRLLRRREDLYSEFLAMEELLSQYQSEGSYLSAQLENINNNFRQILSNSR
jgi:flagellar hook-associated protein 2